MQRHQLKIVCFSRQCIPNEFVATHFVYVNKASTNFPRVVDRAARVNFDPLTTFGLNTQLMNRSKDPPGHISRNKYERERQRRLLSCASTHTNIHTYVYTYIQEVWTSALLPTLDIMHISKHIGILMYALSVLFYADIAGIREIMMMRMMMNVIWKECLYCSSLTPVCVSRNCKIECISYKKVNCYNVPKAT